jgi:hypothetical protein
MLAKFEVKVKAGAQFFQTQAIYNPDLFATFMTAVRPYKVKVLAGILLLRNHKMAEFMNANIPGVSVPQEMIDELKAAGDKAEDVGVEIAVRTINAVRAHCDGVHIMAIKGTHRLADIITRPSSADDDSEFQQSSAREEAHRRDRVRCPLHSHCRAGRSTPFWSEIRWAWLYRPGQYAVRYHGGYAVPHQAGRPCGATGAGDR